MSRNERADKLRDMIAAAEQSLLSWKQELSAIERRCNHRWVDMDTSNVVTDHLLGIRVVLVRSTCDFCGLVIERQREETSR